MKLSLQSLLLILFATACVDRIDFDLGAGLTPVVITGYISDQPGPYKVELAKAIDLDDKLAVRNLISAKRIVLSDNVGNSEELVQTETGKYQTSAGGIQGVRGRAYTLRVELLDGRIYESKPDTITDPGVVERTYFNFKSEVVKEAKQYGFDIFFDSNSGGKSNYRYLWRLVGTYQIETNPELYTESCGESRCPRPRQCSGYIYSGGLQQVGPCSCCSCWITLQGNLPLISDNQLVQNGRFLNIKAGYVPLDSWVFMHKVHVEVQQQSLSDQAFAFWKAVLNQKAAAASLFQPAIGRIPGNFIQKAGPSANAEGIFYATAISSKALFINRSDVPDPTLLTDPEVKFTDSCIKFGNATTDKPAFWIE